MKSLFVAAAGAAALLTVPAAAQEAAAPAPGSERISQLIVFGDDPCPQSTGDEIVVCARKPESDRYRIPENLRSETGDKEIETWTERATELQYVGRAGIGSCSPVGPGGMTGCYEELVRKARAERQGRDSVNWNRLIEEARRERLSRIDAEAEAVEQQLNPAE
ncbi:hypothetical protein [Sphingosinicella humi]|uniref:Uncharacterized protein n=1 Tax=Allosphingosinicella humi TaxID=2068657 RepID=A0A2U2J3T4_9SPHN|nr:hypothetical protein [Sphingosinicella humi]PWG02987.1 hypothetical protein DF286_08980 [Sphingosinicella humi]